jgi:cation diffusion facilitator family transporter
MSQETKAKNRRTLPLVEGQAVIDPASCLNCARIAPWYSFWGNLALAIHKLVVGLLGRSTALVADAIHSFGDVLGSTSVVISTRMAGKQPDKTFPFGRGKAEFVSAVFVYVMLLLLAGGIIFTSGRSILRGDISPPHLVTAASAVVSVLYNYLMYKFTTCVGRRNSSPAILADAFENRADAIASIAVIGGIVAARFIHPICDPIAALIVGVVIFWNCQEQLRKAAEGLMDRGLPEEEVAFIRACAAEQPGVLNVPFIRTRQTGVRYWIDLGIEVGAELSVDAADEIVGRVRNAVSNTPQCHFVEVYVFPARPVPTPLVGQPALEPLR